MFELEFSGLLIIVLYYMQSLQCNYFLIAFYKSSLIVA